MCSVVGYIGKNPSRSYILEGLARLEYRGYDSAGIVCIHAQTRKLVYIKSQGGISNLLEHANKSLVDGHIGMGHTRWSTHGAASTENAHPHFDCHKKLAIVHNGIIENHASLKSFLLDRGHIFKSETDTEVIAHLLEYLLERYDYNLKQAALALVNKIEGAYACSVIADSHPNQILLIRKRSPLCIGLSDDEKFIASDVLAFAGKSNKVLFLPDESCAIVTQQDIDLFDFKGTSIAAEYDIIDITWHGDAKQGYEHFMLKEIYEQKKVIQDTVLQLSQAYNLGKGSLLKKCGLNAKKIKSLSGLHLIGCGTSYHAACLGKFFFEHIAHIPTNVLLASEMRYRPVFLDRHSLNIAVSQSGETADTLEAIRYLNTQPGHVIGLTNVTSSTIVRLADGYLQTYAGPELAVASTKAFSAQVATFYMLAHIFAFSRKIITQEELFQSEERLLLCAELLENTIETYRKDITQTHAPFYAQFDKAFFLGRHMSYPFAQEAALKLQEISYIFTTACPAGELKHGPLALVDQYLPIFIFSSQDDVIYQKLLANAQEVKARNGHVIAFVFEGQDELISLADTAFTLPRVQDPLLGPLVMTGLMQFLVYHIAKVLGRSIDKPRNLAKSVTVE